MKRLAAAVALAALAVPVAALAQEPNVVELRIDRVDATDYPNIDITVTVPEELIGQDIPLSDWFVGEDGEARSFDVVQLPADELEVVVVLDTSGSMEGAPLASAKTAVTNFVDAMPTGVQMALVGFGSQSRVLVPFTTDPDEMKSGLASASASGQTALYDALVSASDEFDRSSDARRTVVLLSDGGDTISESTIEEAIVKLLALEARFVAVELQSEENDSTKLLRLAISAQGDVVPATDPQTLDGIFGEVASDLVNQYVLSFVSSAGGLTELSAAVRSGDIQALNIIEARFPEQPTVTTLPPDPVSPATTVVASPVFDLPEARSGFVVTLGPFARTPGLLLGLAGAFIALFGVVYLVRPRPGSAAVLQGLRLGKIRDKNVLSDLADRATLFAEETLNRGEGTGRIASLIEQAGLRLRVGELVLIVIASSLVGYVLGTLWAGLIGGAIIAVAAVIVVYVVLAFLAQRRSNIFRGQLPDALQLMAGGLRAGFGLLQAIEGVASENLEPASSEFNRVRLEVQLGRDLEDALQAMAGRLRSEDLSWATEAIAIHREIGGDLAQLLEQVSGTVRERETIRRQIDVLSAEGRISAIVLLALPIFLAFVTWTIAPDYLGELTESGIGQALIVGGLVLMAVGVYWVRRIIKLVY